MFLLIQSTCRLFMEGLLGSVVDGVGAADGVRRLLRLGDMRVVELSAMFSPGGSDEKVTIHEVAGGCDREKGRASEPQGELARFKI